MKINRIIATAILGTAALHGGFILAQNAVSGTAPATNALESVPAAPVVAAPVVKEPQTIHGAGDRQTMQRLVDADEVVNRLRPTLADILRSLSTASEAQKPSSEEALKLFQVIGWGILGLSLLSLVSIWLARPKGKADETALLNQKVDDLDKKVEAKIEELKREISDSLRQSMPTENIRQLSKGLDSLKQVVEERFRSAGEERKRLCAKNDLESIKSLQESIRSENEVLKKKLEALQANAETVAKKENDVAKRESAVEQRERAAQAKIDDCNRRLQEERNAGRNEAQQNCESRIAVLENALVENQNLLKQQSADAIQKAVALQVEAGKGEIVRNTEAASAGKIADLEKRLSVAEASASNANAGTRECEERLRQREGELLAMTTKLQATEAATREEVRKAVQAREIELSTEKNTLEKALMQAELNAQTLKASVEKMESNVKALEGRIYPRELLANGKFGQLRAHLESWESQDAGAADIVLASLRIFLNREALPIDSWQLALQNVSRGISIAMKAVKASSEEAVAELALWRDMIMELAGEDPGFSLMFPTIGAKIDTSWMSAKSRSTMVSRVLAWAVYNAYGVRYNADVE